jgi:hypothetical protein
MLRAQLIEPLGLARMRVLECLGGNDRFAAGYFSIDATQDLFVEFRNHVARLNDQWASEKDPLTRNLLAAGRLVIGDVDAAYEILDRSPAAEIKLDHGAGSCTVVPFATIAAVFPLPRELSDSRKWYIDSPALEALRGWLQQHRDLLSWSESDGVYRLG